MSSNERLILKGRLMELKEEERNLSLKISGNIKLLKSYFFEIENGEIDQFEEKRIELFSNELVDNIIEIKRIKLHIKKVEDGLL